MWAIEPDIVKAIQTEHRNPVRLPSVEKLQRHHVLERPAQFQADHVGGDEGLEVVGRAQLGHTARHVDVGAADHGGGGFARGDLLAQVRAGDGHEPVGGQVERLGEPSIAIRFACRAWKSCPTR